MKAYIGNGRTNKRTTVLVSFDDEETAKKFVEAWNEVHK
jgi:hypothetical protein